MKNRHDRLREAWELNGKPELMFRYRDDPWLLVQGEPSFNPAFDYCFADPTKSDGYWISTNVRKPIVLIRRDSDVSSTKKICDTYEYKRGYKQALDDVRAEAERLANNRICNLKSSM